MKNFIPKARSVQQVAAVVLGLVLLAGVNACKKDMGAGGGGETVVQIQMLGSESSRGSNPLQRGPSQTGSVPRSAASQVITVPFGEENTLTISLEEVGGSTNTSGSGRELVQQRAAVDRGGDQRASTNTPDGPEPLANGTQWGLMVYDENGVRVSNKTYTHNQDYSNEADTVSGLEVGKAYSFVSYSTNETTLPAITGGENLATAITAMTKADLMFQRQDITITSGMNTLQVLLKHQFSLITPKISVATASSTTTVWGGEIESVGPASFVSRTGGQVKFEDGSVTFEPGTENKPVTFTDAAGTGQEFTADPVLVLNPANVPGGFTIQGLTINDITQDVVIDENSAQQLNIEPGKHYNMNMTFNAPCVDRVDSDEFVLVDGNSSTWTMPAADFGFVFNVVKLDNSFNLTINGEPLIETRSRTVTRTQYRTREFPWQDWTYTFGPWQGETFSTWAEDDLEFQRSGSGTGSSAITHNIEFVSGARWGMNIPGTGPAVEEIWQMDSWNLPTNSENPLVRVQINPDGTIIFTGRRTESDLTQYPLQIIPVSYTDPTNGNWGILTNERTQTAREIETRVNTNVTWNANSSNTVTGSQKVAGVTHIEGMGYGLVRTTCQ